MVCLTFCLMVVSLFLAFGKTVLPVMRAFISSKMLSAIFPNSSVEVVGTLLVSPDMSGYIDS